MSTPRAVVVVGGAKGPRPLHICIFISWSFLWGRAWIPPFVSFFTNKILQNEKHSRVFWGCSTSPPNEAPWRDSVWRANSLLMFPLNPDVSAHKELRFFSTVFASPWKFPFYTGLLVPTGQLPTVHHSHILVIQIIPAAQNISQYLSQIQKAIKVYPVKKQWNNVLHNLFSGGLIMVRNNKTPNRTSLFHQLG